jgi:hypothetical protein
MYFRLCQDVTQATPYHIKPSTKIMYFRLCQDVTQATPYHIKPSTYADSGALCTCQPSQRVRPV